MISFVTAIFLLFTVYLVNSANLPLLKRKDGLLVSRKVLRSKASQVLQLDGKYTGEPCEYGSSTCVFPRECRYWSDTSCSSDSTTCECYIPGYDQLCLTSGDCRQGDRCYKNPWDPSYAPRCVTCDFDLVPPTSFDRLKPVDEGSKCNSDASSTTIQVAHRKSC